MAAGGLAFRVSGVRRVGPLVRITTLGQIQAEALTRLEVIPGTVALTGGVIEVPETHAMVTLTANEHRFQGLFTAPTSPRPQPLQVRLQG